MTDGVTCYERDETLCEDQMCVRTGCRLRNERLARSFTGSDDLTDWLNDQVRFHESSVASKDPAIQGHIAFLRRAIARVTGAAQGQSERGARDALQELYEFCCQLGDFRPDSRLGRKVIAILAAPQPPANAGGDIWTRANLVNLMTAVSKANLDITEQQLFGKVADAMLTHLTNPAYSSQDTLKIVAGLFAESVHETYTREEVVSIVEDMIRVGRLPDPVPASPSIEPWTIAGFWEYVGGMAGEQERDQMRDTLAERGLRIVGIGGDAYTSHDPQGVIREGSQGSSSEILGRQTRDEIIEGCAKIAETAGCGDQKCVSCYGNQIASAIRALSMPSTPRAAPRLCSCKASARDGQHMAWCPAMSSTDKSGAA